MKLADMEIATQPTAVIAETTSWTAFPALWPRLLAEVWAAIVPRRDEIVPGRNVMLFLDDAPQVEVGVEIAGPFASLGRVVASSLPAGRVVASTHRGSWDAAPAHRAIVDECDRLGLERVGPRWEIYGHHNTPGDAQVEVYYLVR